MRIQRSKRKLSYLSRLSRTPLCRSFANPSREVPLPLCKERPPTSELLKEERDFSGTSHVFVYVMLPSRFINMECELVNPDGLMDQLKQLKSIGVDGVSVNTWWGIVEANNPQNYNWDGYKQLFRMVLEAGFNKIQVVMSFHECDDDPHIPLPKWIKEIGQQNPDIYFTDKNGRRNPECLSWGIDEEPVLKGRTAVEVYADYMRSFRAEFGELIQDPIRGIEIGLGPCGELRYPSCPAKHGWEYPGIGEFQCYDKYLLKSLEKAAADRGCLSWGLPPDNAGNYNSKPEDTKFFCDGGEHNSDRGRFFLNWYSKHLIDHAERVLAKDVRGLLGINPSVKLSGMHWWHKTASQAVERIAGFNDGFKPVTEMLYNYYASAHLTYADPEGLVWEELDSAWYSGVSFGSENALPCYDKQDYRKILEFAKPKYYPYYIRSCTFTYRDFNQTLLQQHNFDEFKLFLKKMHGDYDDDDEDDDMKEADKGDTSTCDVDDDGTVAVPGSKKRKSSSMV